MKICFWGGVAVSLALCGCDTQESAEFEVPKITAADQVTTLADQVTGMKLESSGLVHGAEIDKQYTVEGRDVSPPLTWEDAPDGTESFALICDDPDAPSARRPGPEPWVHWVIYNIPADRNGLPEGISNELEPNEVPGAKQGSNSWPSDNVGYRGPAPPPGSGPHRYFFKLHALDTTLDVDAGATKVQLLEAMSEHVLAEAQLMGTYERQ
jgi:Raf kinase inhibitor-like YbhB/YbcL family protein